MANYCHGVRPTNTLHTNIILKIPWRGKVRFMLPRLQIKGKQEVVTKTTGFSMLWNSSRKSC